MAKAKAPKRSRVENLKGQTPGAGKRVILDEDGLTMIQATFINEIIGGRNQTEAAKISSPKSKNPRQVAANTMRLPQVRAALARRRAEIARKADFTLEDVVRELGCIAFANVDDFTTVDASGRRGVDWAKLQALPEEVRRAKLAAVLEIQTEDMGTVGASDDENARIITKTKLRFHDKKGALVDLGKHLGGFVQRGELTGRGGGPIPVARIDVPIPDDPAEAAKLYQKIMAGS